MAHLSSLIYAFHKEDYGNDDIGNHVCDRINQRNISQPLLLQRRKSGKRRRRIQQSNRLRSDYNRTIPKGIHCEWYHHDWIDGTQVMIVSSTLHNYIAVVFAGTDDLTTSLLDADVLLTPFGFAPPPNNNIHQTPPLFPSSHNNNHTDTTRVPPPLYNVSLEDPNVRVHAGFDSSIFNARSNLFGEIVLRVEQLRAHRVVPPPHDLPRIYTTGHSLGASHAILTAVGLLQYYEQVRTQRILPPVPSGARRLQPADAVVSINFGAPQTGNTAWRDAIHTGPLFQQRLRLYRFVLGWDLVPRLPAVLQHVGHTIQMMAAASSFSHSNTTAVAAYYHHLGNATLQYASVPLGWSATPFLWIPGALSAHFITAYVQWFLDRSAAMEEKDRTVAWLSDFERTSDPAPPVPYDDDYYVEPPAVLDVFVQ